MNLSLTESDILFSCITQNCLLIWSSSLFRRKNQRFRRQKKITPPSICPRFNENFASSWKEKFHIWSRYWSGGCLLSWVSDTAHSPCSISYRVIILDVATSEWPLYREPPMYTRLPSASEHRIETSCQFNFPNESYCSLLAYLKHSIVAMLRNERVLQRHSTLGKCINLRSNSSL